MSSTGDPSLPQATPEAIGGAARRRRRRPRGATSRATNAPGRCCAAPAFRSTRPRTWSAPHVPRSAASIRRALRASSPPSSRRATAPRRSTAVRVPTLVIHGDADPLVRHEGGVGDCQGYPGCAPADDQWHGPCAADLDVAATDRRHCGARALILVECCLIGSAPMLKHEYADVNGVRLHYARAGQGKLILFVHGFPRVLVRLEGPAGRVRPRSPRRRAGHARLQSLFQTGGRDRLRGTASGG